MARKSKPQEPEVPQDQPSENLSTPGEERPVVAPPGPLNEPQSEAKAPAFSIVTH